MSNATARIWTPVAATIIASPQPPRLKVIDGQAAHCPSPYDAFLDRSRLSGEAGHVYPYAAPGSDGLVPVVTMAGVRHIAARAGRWEYQGETHWSGVDGRWHATWIADEPPSAARVGVRRLSAGEPAYAVVSWSRYETSDAVLRASAQIWLADLAEAKALADAYRDAFGKVFGSPSAGELGLGTLVFDTKGCGEIGFVAALP